MKTQNFQHQSKDLPASGRGHDSWLNIKSPGGGHNRAMRFNYNREEEELSMRSPGPTTGVFKS